MRFTPAALTGLALLGAIACADQLPVSPSISAPNTASRVAALGSTQWAKVDTGVTGPGSIYVLYIPQVWNGDAIYFVHGIRPPQEPIAIGDDQDNFAEVRDALGGLGYAIAYSSFSENGLAIKDGAQRTHQLRGLLAAELHGMPTRNYLMGYSLGALASLSLVEQFPKEYDGLLAMCGEVGGSIRELQYIGDLRVLFDFYYPGVLPGNVISPPAIPPTLEEVQALVVGALTANPPSSLFGLYTIASTSQTPLAFVPGDVTNPADPAFHSLVQSLVAGLYYQLVGTQDALNRTHGHSPYSNRATTYTLGTPVIPAYASSFAANIAFANAQVPRYDMTPDARNYLENYFVPSGDIKIPVLTVHNLWDYLVPYFHEPAFASIVANAEASNMLTQAPPVLNYGHCNFSTPLVVNSFEALVGWVTTGNKPSL